MHVSRVVNLAKRRRNSKKLEREYKKKGELTFVEARLLLLWVWASQNASRQTSGLSRSCGAVQPKFSLSEYNKYIYSMCGLSLTSINVSSFLFFFFFFSLNKSEVLENCISGENWVREGLEFKRVEVAKWYDEWVSEGVRNGIGWLGDIVGGGGMRPDFTGYATRYLQVIFGIPKLPSLSSLNYRPVLSLSKSTG